MLVRAAEAAQALARNNLFNAWKPDRTVGPAFAPLVDWIDHPRARQSLKRMGSTAADRSRHTYARARENYFARLVQTHQSLPEHYLLLALFEQASRFATEARLADLLPLL